jgi:MoaA/NifB/PqqE/SkfB family radical SAM enzyme
MIKKIKVALGIITKKVLSGPLEVSVDLTRQCGMHCLMCWWRSPLIEKTLDPDWARQELSYPLYQDLIKDFKKMQVKRIILGGQGDPLLYPKLLDAIGLAKKFGLEVVLITCGIYFNERIIKSMFDLGLDSMDISLHAATASTYEYLHPGNDKEAFAKILDSLAYFNKLKKDFPSKVPKINLVYAICQPNYKETVKIIELAKETGAQGVCLKRIDVIPETKGLLLNNDELGELEVLLEKAKERARQLKIYVDIDNYRKYVLQGLTSGSYTSNFYSQMPCYVGWRSARILSDASVIPCCGCFDIVLGNIGESSFKNIWHSDQYKRFRQQSINIQKDGQLFKRCKCYSCIDHLLNFGVYRKLHPFKAKRIT